MNTYDYVVYFDAEKGNVVPAFVQATGYRNAVLTAKDNMSIKGRDFVPVKIAVSDRSEIINYEDIRSEHVEKTY